MAETTERPNRRKVREGLVVSDVQDKTAIVETVDRAEDTSASGLVLIVDEHGGVLVEPDVTPVWTPPLLLGPDDDALHDLALLDGGTRISVLHRGGKDVADRGVATLGAT